MQQNYKIKETIPECCWLFGRGASIAHGLNWSVPKGLTAAFQSGEISREKYQLEIEHSLRKAQETIPTPYAYYKALLEGLNANGGHGYIHRFVTTNWDTLLQRELDWLIHTQNNHIVPKWMGGDSSVNQINGTIECKTSNRASIVFETDDGNQRSPSLELNSGFNRLLECKKLIVVGLSLECTEDLRLMQELRKHSKDLSIGESSIAIVNPSADAYEKVQATIQYHLPEAKPQRHVIGFEELINGRTIETILEQVRG